MESQLYLVHIEYLVDLRDAFISTISWIQLILELILIIQECSTKQITTKKQIPNTSCDQVSREICVTPACPLVVENKVCQDVEKTFVTMVPKESCELHPREVCTGKGS